MEIDGLAFAGKGLITDPSSGIQDELYLEASIDLAQIVLGLDTQLSQDGLIHPKIAINEITFQMHPDIFRRSDLLKVDAKGDLPLYKSHKFEEGVKKFMIARLKDFEKLFQSHLQKAEREILASFSYKKELNFGLQNKVVAHSSLGEDMSLQGDHLVISYYNKFEGVDLDTLKHNHREISPVFSEEAHYMRDV